MITKHVSQTREFGLHRLPKFTTEFTREDWAASALHQAIEVMSLDPVTAKRMVAWVAHVLESKAGESNAPHQRTN